MTATGQLKDEHEGITLLLRILERVCVKLERKEEVDTIHLEQMLEFIRVFADKCHHGKEEDLLFPELEKSGIPKEPGPIGVMLTEHNRGRAHVRVMNQAVARYKKEGGDMSDFVENARNYITLLTQHIQKENNVLFPMGDRVLSKEKQDKLLIGFEKLEQERIGEGTHERFHQLLHHLQEVYLK